MENQNYILLNNEANRRLSDSCSASLYSPNSQPFSGWTITQWEYLWIEVVLLELFPLPQIPQTNGII